MSAHVNGSASAHAIARVMLTALRDAELIDAVDVQMASVCVRRGAVPDASVLSVALGVALVSRARREGHSGVSLMQLVEERAELQPVIEPWLPSGAGALNAAAWAELLRASSVVDDGASAAPLVLRDDLLQFRRYYEAELRIAVRIAAMLGEPTVGDIPAFGIITGGPGTGKTTAVARQLVALAESGATWHIGLAAPTGKAAARLTESIRERIAEHAAAQTVPAAMPTEASTLHRLLKYSPRSDTYKRSGSDPLDDDLIIVDEASMVDVLMLDAMLRAIKPGGRLLLVGDHHQLASVDTGDALGALCRAADSGAANALTARVTTLTRSWRFEKQPAIGALATAILQGDADALHRACTMDPAVRLVPPPTSADALLEPVVPHLERCLAADSPDALLSAFESFRLLAPEREGRLGVQGINASVERWLAHHGHAVHDVWYHRRPVLVTANDYSTNVFNGDLGVVWREQGDVSVYFRAIDGGIRRVAPVRLPAVETAWAMTVHKSQGSEFAHVQVVVPDHQSRVMNRELLYTAVTRARESVTLVATIGALTSAMFRTAGRTSGLEQRLIEALRQ